MSALVECRTSGCGHTAVHEGRCVDCAVATFTTLLDAVQSTLDGARAEIHRLTEALNKDVASAQVRS